MAKARNNIMVRGLSGSFGDQMVIKIDKAGRTIVGNKPKFDKNREWSPAQKAQHAAFRAARTYAKGAKNNAVYVAKAEGTPLNPFNVAMADWFHKPEVLEIDARGWNGGIGQPIHIKAVDDVQVKQVTVTIRDQSNILLESGEAVPSQIDGLMWIYSTQTVISPEGSPQVTATAEDLPGHITQMTKIKEKCRCEP